MTPQRQVAFAVVVGLLIVVVLAILGLDGNV